METWSSFYNMLRSRTFNVYIMSKDITIILASMCKNPEWKTQQNVKFGWNRGISLREI